MNPLAHLKSLWQRPEARLGGKLLALQIVIEIPFLILEATLLTGAISGSPRALALWQSALLVAGVYLFLEAVFWLIQRARGDRQHRWFESERIMLGWAWGWVQRKAGRRADEPR